MLISKHRVATSAKRLNITSAIMGNIHGDDISFHVEMFSEEYCKIETEYCSEEIFSKIT